MTVAPAVYRMPSMPLALFLMAAGAAPFLGGALATVLGWTELPILGATRAWFESYGLVIAAFMAGTLWGRGRPGGADEDRVALIASNAVALCLWAGAALTSGGWRDILLAALFVALLVIEGARSASLAYPPAYRRGRVAVTALVVASLLLHAAAQA
jgi:hypothetical protein